jgi:alkanesulfonate monooxygenase SsuD/methylene tetrahydromethanopterin reductase-like flavin-dependent oxidoreductase (luciferase family)
VSWSGDHYQVPEMMIEPHPPAPVPIMCGGESDVALRRAARLCDGWVGYAYAQDEAIGYAQRLTELRQEYGRENEPFDVLVALLEPPSVDLYRRAEDAGITQVMVRPWFGQDTGTAGAEAYRPAIEKFAEEIIEKCR